MDSDGNFSAESGGLLLAEFSADAQTTVRVAGNDRVDPSLRRSGERPDRQPPGGWWKHHNQGRELCGVWCQRQCAFRMAAGLRQPRLGYSNLRLQLFTDVTGTIGTGTVQLGSIRMRPVMAGYGYTRVRGRWAITGDLVGGYSFNSLKLDSSIIQEYSRRTGATGVDAEATNAFALKPEIQVWYDINSRFGLKLDGGYLIARPSVVITSSLGEDVHHIRADTFLFTVGLVYSLF